MSRYTLYVKGACKRGGRFRPRCGDKLHVRRHDLARLLNDDKTRTGELLLFSVSKNSWPKKKTYFLSRENAHTDLLSCGFRRGRVFLVYRDTRLSQSTRSRAPYRTRRVCLRNDGENGTAGRRTRKRYQSQKEERTKIL